MKINLTKAEWDRIEIMVYEYLELDKANDTKKRKAYGLDLEAYNKLRLRIHLEKKNLIRLKKNSVKSSTQSTIVSKQGDV